MANVPAASVSVSATAGAQAQGLDLLCLWSPVDLNADMTPRMFGGATAIRDFHGYCEGVEYSALHFTRTRKSVLFVGLPISVPGAVGREDTSGNSGSASTTLAVGGSGVLGPEHTGKLRVITGGTVGTDQILLGLSLDGGKSEKRVRLGAASSYVIQNVNITVNFGAGTLVAGDVIHTWEATAPRSSQADWTTARQNLAAQLKAFRSVMLLGDLQSDTEALAFNTEIESYASANERFVYGRAAVYDRLPLATLGYATSRMVPGTSLTFAEVGAVGDTVTRASGSWLSDGFAVGDFATFAATSLNNLSARIDALSATVITLDADDLEPEVISTATVTSVPGLAFDAGTKTITRSRGSFLADGFRAGDTVTVAGTASNNGTLTIASITATAITTVEALVDEDVAASSVTLQTGQTKAAWMAAVDTEFAPVDDKPYVDLAAGKGRVRSPFSGWHFRASAMWAVSLREYQHDVHITAWRKSDGPVDFDLFDDDGNLVEWDDRADGGAGSAARFTTLRTWANGPAGAFVTQSLTRATDGSILSYTHNVAVVNVACNTVHEATENVIGRSLELNDDGTATTDALNTLKREVNRALELALLVDAKGEGPRASKAVWTPAPDDVLNVPGATITGVLDLNLNGTVHSVVTNVRVRSGGE